MKTHNTSTRRNLSVIKNTGGLFAFVGLVALVASVRTNAADSTNLALYDFSTNLSSSANAAHVTASDWSWGPDYAQTTPPSIGRSSLEYDFFIRHSSYINGSEGDARKNGTFLAFNITVEEGWTAALEQFSADIKYQWSLQQPRFTTWQLTVSTSEDGPFVNVGDPVTINATKDATSSVPEHTTASMTVNLSNTAFSSITGTHTLWFRIYTWKYGNANEDISRIDNVVITGNVTATAVPETSTFALFAAIATGVLLTASRLHRHRRRRLSSSNAPDVQGMSS